MRRHLHLDICPNARNDMPRAAPAARGPNFATRESMYCSRHRLRQLQRIEHSLFNPFFMAYGG